MSNYGKQHHLKTEEDIPIHVTIPILSQLYLGVFKKYINLDNSKTEQRPKNKIPKATSQDGINLPLHIYNKSEQEKFTEVQVQFCFTFLY